MSVDNLNNRIISVIVPCYNVAQYLDRCVDSICGQTYKNLEIILVNDGSTDDTRVVCERLAEKDERIRVVNKENGGLSDARNAGIEVAHGDFYAFVDGDDYIVDNAYELMLSEMQDEEVSLVSAGIIGIDIEGNKSQLLSKERKLLTRKEAYINLLGSERTIGQSSCNKLFRANLFDNLRYKKGIINEDMEILPKILDRCTKIIILNVPIYYYIKRPGSITELEFSQWKYDGIKIVYSTYELCENRYPELLPYAEYYKMDAFNKMYEELISSSNRDGFRMVELKLRSKMIKSCISCLKYNNIKSMYYDKIKNILINAFLGKELVTSLVKIKQRVMKNA